MMTTVRVTVMMTMMTMMTMMMMMTTTTTVTMTQPLLLQPLCNRYYRRYYC